jgi:hypothetical protein
MTPVQILSDETDALNWISQDIVMSQGVHFIFIQFRKLLLILTLYMKLEGA